jgi:GDP-D-mannose dehydratase
VEVKFGQPVAPVTAKQIRRKAAAGRAESLLAKGLSRSSSSTCATYGAPETIPISEDHPQRPVNPYGYSKLVVERMLADLDAARGLRSISLRYFNAVGADPDGGRSVRPMIQKPI